MITSNHSEIDTCFVTRVFIFMKCNAVKFFSTYKHLNQRSEFTKALFWHSKGAKISNSNSTEDLYFVIVSVYYTIPFSFQPALSDYHFQLLN